MNGNFFFRFLAAFTVVVLILGAGASGSAQKKGKDGVIRLEETVIEGRVRKPNAFFIATRQGMVYEVMELRESFVDEIPKVVDTGDF